MAKNNKYASINFNHIYEKSSSITTNNNHHQTKNPSSSSLSSSSSFSSASYSAVSAPNKHGRILVLTRPTPKPKPVVTHSIPTPTSPPPPTQPNPILPDRTLSDPGIDSISLRPLGRTGTPPSLPSSPVLNHDKDKDFKEFPSSPKVGKFVPPHLRPGFVPKEEPGRFRDNRRPKSGGGYERMLSGGGGNRPNSSG